MKKVTLKKPAFKFIGGAPALDFVNTTSWASDGSINAAKERFNDFSDLIRWAEKRRLLKSSEARAMRRLAKDDPRRAEQELVAAKHLRQTLRDLFHVIAAGEHPDTSLLNAFNRAVCTGMSSVDLAPTSDGPFAWRFGDCRDDLGTIYGLVAWDAAQIVTSERVRDVRRCGACTWVFLDESRRHNRRWCSMDPCGSREKAKRHYRKKKKSD
jgi:predicted RNA-binding Zn ribbon-like protein